ncbi:MAG: V-type ATP synthase subunit D [Chloroflexota bacterium]
MARISTTRTELLARRAQRALARQGRDLLEQKRTALLQEFLRVADTVIERSDALERSAAGARRALARAEAEAGFEAVLSASFASRAEFPLRVETASVMGVKFPRIEQKPVRRSALQREYGVTMTSITIDEAAGAFEEEVEAILRLAESELRLTRLAEEIARTSRRVNALTHVLIPRLEAECKYIQMALDERERSDRFRLKRVKHLLEAKREGAHRLTSDSEPPAPGRSREVSMGAAAVGCPGGSARRRWGTLA